MRIGIAYSLAPADRGGEGPDDRFEEFDKPETIEALARVIRAEGHDVALLGDGRDFLARMLTDPPAFVFNVAEGAGVGRSREARVPAACEMLGVPYSGSDPLTLALALDKGSARRFLGPRMIDMPNGWVCPSHADRETFEFMLRAEMNERRDFPVILKPSFEGSSKGIRGRCLADSIPEAAETFERLRRDYAQPVLVEQFIEGVELTVGLIGNPPEVQIVGIMEVVPRSPSPRFVYSLEVKRDWRRLVEYEAPARLPETVERLVRHVAITIFHHLDCRDVARIDFRLKDGVPYFIEANPLPGLAPGTSDLVILAEGYGIGYDELIRRILRTALTRCGLA